MEIYISRRIPLFYKIVYYICMPKITTAPIHKARCLFLAIGLFGICICSAFGVQGVVPYSKVLKDALDVAATHPHWVVAQGAGNSMAPYYDAHTLLLVEKVPYTQLSPGMIAVYKDADGQFVGHSLLALSEEGWVAKGFNNSETDPSLVTASNFVGVIFGTLQHEGTNSPSSNLITVHGKHY